MSKHFIHTLLLVGTAALTSCSTAGLITLDILKPATITIPQYSRGVVVVNGLDAESYHNTNLYTPLNKRQQPFAVTVDSIRLYAVEALRQELTDSRYFYSVELATDTLEKHPSGWLSAAKVERIREESGVDVLLYYDNLLIDSKLTDQKIDGSLLYTSYEVQVRSNIQLYLPNDTTPQNYLFNDTLFWQGYGYTLEEAHAQIPDIASCFGAAAHYAAERYETRVAPTVVQEERYLFAQNSSPTMREASLYWKWEQLDEASYLWEYTYKENRNNRIRGMAASNLALYYELQDNYKEALKWAKCSLQQFRAKGNYREYIRITKAYVQSLQQRIEDDAILQKQI